MKLLRIYQASVIISCILYVAYWFSPWLYGYLDSEVQSVLSWGGYKSAFDLPQWFWNIYLTLNIISYIGMFLLRKVFRALFLILIVVSYPLSSIGGMSVMTGLEVILIDISTFLAGFIIALAYYSDIKNEFY